MALEVRMLRDMVGSSAALIADRRLWLTADRATAVEEGDPRAAFLLAGAGSEIGGAEADRLGLAVVDGRVLVGSAPTPEPPKARRAPANKARRKGEDK